MPKVNKVDDLNKKSMMTAKSSRMQYWNKKKRRRTEDLYLLANWLPYQPWELLLKAKLMNHQT